MKKVIMMILMMVMVSLTGCIDTTPKPPSSEKVMQRKTERAMKEATRQVGFPAIKNFQEKKFMKMLYEERDKENLICHAYLVNEMNGKIGQYLGQCIGYGIPYSTQYSNPEKVAASHEGYQASRSWLKLAQPEPNGLYTPTGLSATWLMMIDKKTKKPRPVYIEPSIIVSPFKLHK